jgi:integrase
MLALLHVGGLRRAELAGLKLSDYDPETKILRLRGKGNKERQVYAEGGADLLLARCLELRGEGEPVDPLFLPVRKDGVVQRTDPHGEKKSSLSDQAVYKMVKRRQREAKFKEVSPTTSARPSWAISSTPYEIYRRFRSSRGIRIPPQPPVTTGAASGRCGRPRATCTSPTSAISHPTQGRHTRVPYPFRGAAEALGSQPRASRIT